MNDICFDDIYYMLVYHKLDDIYVYYIYHIDNDALLESFFAVFYVIHDVIASFLVDVDA